MQAARMGGLRRWAALCVLVCMGSVVPCASFLLPSPGTPCRHSHMRHARVHLQCSKRSTPNVHLHKCLPAVESPATSILLYLLLPQLARTPNTLMQREGFQAHCVVPDTWETRAALRVCPDTRGALSLSPTGRLTLATRKVSVSMGW